MFDSQVVKKALRDKFLLSPHDYLSLSNKAAVEGEQFLAVQILRAGSYVFPVNNGLKTRLEMTRDLNFALFKRLGEPPKRRIFGIGLSRTGTSSLNESLTMIGYNTAHWMNPSAEKKIIDCAEFLAYDALSDTPVAFLFEMLHYAFPGSHFIYTYRNIDAWNRSVAAHFHWIKDFNTFKSLCLNGNGQGGIVDSCLWRMIHLTLYANSPSWTDAYCKHEQRVENFFNANPDARLLKIDITDPSQSSNDKWAIISNYLALSDDNIPLLPFPKKNNRSSINQKKDPALRMELPQSWQANLKLKQFSQLIATN